MRARTLVLGVALASVLSGVGPMALAGGFMILAGLVITASGVLLACPEGGRRQKRTS